MRAQGLPPVLGSARVLLGPGKPPLPRYGVSAEPAPRGLEEASPEEPPQFDTAPVQTELPPWSKTCCLAVPCSLFEGGFRYQLISFSGEMFGRAPFKPLESCGYVNPSQLVTKPSTFPGRWDNRRGRKEGEYMLFHTVPRNPSALLPVKTRIYFGL